MSLGAAPSSSSAYAEGRELVKWQRKLLPFMTRSLVVLALIFFGLGAYDVYETQSFVKGDRTPSARSKIEDLLHEAKHTASSSNVDLVHQSLLVLEADGIDKRYRQASALLMSRIWTRQLAFMTGMILAFIGAAFILGKLSESRTDLNVGDEHWKAAISSSSPGLILASLGTLLIGTALVVQPKIEVQDRPVYFVSTGVLLNTKGRGATEQIPLEPDAGAIDPGLSESGTLKK